MKRIKRKICCEMMEYNTTNHCSVHTNPFECPDCLIYIDKYNRYQGIRKGSWNLLSNGTIKILYHYCGQIIVTGNVVNNVFRVGDAWVWNGIGTP